MQTIIPIIAQLSLENVIFDPTYYILTSLIIILALVCAAIAFKIEKGTGDQIIRDRTMGTGVAALGFAIIFVTATAFLVILRAGEIGGFLYQQAQFSIVYMGTAMVLYGVDKMLIPRNSTVMQSDQLTRGKRIRAALWIVFAVSVAIAAAYLFNPSTYTVTGSGATEHVAQQLIFWLPPFVVLGAGAMGFLVFAIWRKDTNFLRRHAIWFGLFCLLEFIGILRESMLIPSSGDPLADLLLAFIPFTAGSFCLFASVLSIRSSLQELK